MKTGNEKSRWGWSGVASKESIHLDVDVTRRLFALLPKRKSHCVRLITRMQTLGAIYWRYVHQDELGPTRLQQIGALKVLIGQLDLVTTNLDRFPLGLQQIIFERVKSSQGGEPSSDLSGDLFSMLFEAATDVERAITPSDSHLGKIGNGLSNSAELMFKLLCGLDTTTSAELEVESWTVALATTSDTSPDLLGRIAALRDLILKTLTRIQRLRGPQKATSLPWLVSQLCDLWSQETGQLVTSNATHGGVYTSSPQSPAGRFILAAVEALQPEGTPGNPQTPTRAQIIVGTPGDRARAVHDAIRKYVKFQPRIGPRPGPYPRGNKKELPGGTL